MNEIKMTSSLGADDERADVTSLTFSFEPLSVRLSPLTTQHNLKAVDKVIDLDSKLVSTQIDRPDVSYRTLPRSPLLNRTLVSGQWGDQSGGGDTVVTPVRVMPPDVTLYDQHTSSRAARTMPHSGDVYVQ